MDFYQGSRKKPVLDPHASIPVGETVETDWAAWEELVADSEHTGGTMHIEIFPNEATFTE
jgi:hypothetical protein